MSKEKKGFYSKLVMIRIWVIFGYGSVFSSKVGSEYGFFSRK